MRVLFASIAVLGLAACQGAEVNFHDDDMPAGQNDGAVVKGDMALASGDFAWQSPGDLPPATIPSDHPRIYLNATNLQRLKGLVADDDAPAKRFMDMVDNQLGGADVYEFSSFHAALAYQITGATKYADYAIQLADDFVKKEEAAIAAGNAASVADDQYLYVGELVGDLMMTYDWCFDRLTADQKARWIAYANQAVWNVWHNDDAVWNGKSFPWPGWSVDNPANNYYYSFLRATLMLGLATYGENGQAADWIEMFRTTKIENQLLPVFNGDLVGGGSREGTGYGLAMQTLFFLYDVWGQSTGQPIAQLTPHTRDSSYWMQHAIVPTLDRLAPIGDHARESTAALFDYHRNYLQELAALNPDDVASQTSRTLLAQSSVPEMSQGFMYVYDFLYSPGALPTAPLTKLYPTYYGPGTGEVFARSVWGDKNAVWMGFTAGPFTESHAHHDQGQLLVYKKEWLLYDGNIDSHSGLHKEEEAHNLVRLSVGDQPLRMVDGSTSELVALADDAELLYLAGDLSGAYKTSTVMSAAREVVWWKPGIFVVIDRVAPGKGAALQWNSPINPTLSGAHAKVSGTKATADLYLLSPSSTNWTSQTLSSIDPDFMEGYHFEATANTDNAIFLTVIGLDGVVKSTARSDGTNTIGALVTATDNSTIEVQWKTDDFGATIVAKDSGGGTTLSRTLGPGVNTPPLTTP